MPRRAAIHFQSWRQWNRLSFSFRTHFGSWQLHIPLRSGHSWHWRRSFHFTGWRRKSATFATEADSSQRCVGRSCTQRGANREGHCNRKVQSSLLLHWRYLLCYFFTLFVQPCLYLTLQCIPSPCPSCFEPRSCSCRSRSRLRSWGQARACCRTTPCGGGCWDPVASCPCTISPVTSLEHT